MHTRTHIHTHTHWEKTHSVSELTEPDAVDDGILYADSPGEKVALECARRERRRRKIIKELFQTEKAYLNHLELIHKVSLIKMIWVIVILN